ncbi:MAG: Panacea domain-containing protein [Candidatus Rokuibacteriota bacterium]
MAKSPPLPPKLEAVLIRLGKAANLNVTQAVKLPYIVDVIAIHVLGEPITEGHHEAWDKGVVTSEVWHHLTKSQGSPVFHLEPVPWSEERKLVVDAQGDTSALTPAQAELVDVVAQQFGGIRAGDLGRLTKLMNPEIGTWGSNRRADLTESAFERLSDEYQVMAEAVAALTLDELRRDYEVVEDIEEALA